MPVVSQRSTRADVTRSSVVAVLAAGQLVVAVLAGSTTGQPLASAARDYATPLTVAGWAYVVWAPIYLGFLGYGLYQLLPAQRARDVHRRTGWWAAASALANPAWMLAFSGHDMLLAELLIIALMVTLAVVFGRLSHAPASGRVERLAFRTPVALYTGWTSLAAVVGTAATGVWAGLPSRDALATLAAVVVLLATAAIVSSVVLAGTAVLAYAAAAVWALAGIALNDAPGPVAVTCAVAIVVVVVATVSRISRSGNRVRAAWG